MDYCISGAVQAIQDGLHQWLNEFSLAQFHLFYAAGASLITSNLSKQSRLYALSSVSLSAALEYTASIFGFSHEIAVHIRQASLLFSATIIALGIFSSKSRRRSSRFSYTNNPIETTVFRGTKPVHNQPVVNPYRKSLLKKASELGLSVLDPQFAQILDKDDELASFRNEFYVPRQHPENPTSAPQLYFCGNSLGLQPKRAERIVNEELEKWKNLGVAGHFPGPLDKKRPWFHIDESLQDSTARLVGAKPMEVAVMNSLTSNLHLLLVSFYRPTARRHKILVEENPFPSDTWAVISQIKYHGFNPDESLLQIGPRPGETFIRTEDILDLIQREGESIALVMLSGVQFMTGQAFEYERITQAGHRKGCVVGFDMAHAAGNMELQLHNWGIDFACWCSYKYLNSGPGNLSGVFIHERHAYDTSLPRFAGWWGNKQSSRFGLSRDFDPTPGAAGWQLSNPCMLGLAAVIASMEVFDEATMPRLRQKSLHLTSYLEMLLDELVLSKTRDVQLLTPRDPTQRGCQLSLRFPYIPIKEINDLLEQNGVVCDERRPDIIRVAPTPLYNTYAEVFQFVQILAKILGV